ncbi:MAG: heme exporter protein CcmD [bacterium]
MTEFFNMGGYAAYVWPSFALAFVLMTANILSSTSRHKKALQKAQDFHSSNQPTED